MSTLIGGRKMTEMRLGVVESKFADIIWEHEPLSSGELVKVCKKELEWAKSTTYTVLKKLCNRGIFKNENGAVSACMTKEEFHALQSEQFVETTFDGSLPAFIAAFTTRKDLTQEDVAEIRAMIDSIGEK
jgi:predicted transcriptional regulator